MQRVRSARRAMEAAGVTVAVVPAAAASPGIEHRRVIWAHMAARNGALPLRLAWAAAGVGALHSFSADIVEFRQPAQGNRLVAFSLLSAHGAYCAGALYVARPEFSRAGLWYVSLIRLDKSDKQSVLTRMMPRPLSRVTNAAMSLEHMLAGAPLCHVTLFDVGPTFGALKRSVAMRPLRFRDTLRRAAWS